MVFNWITNWYWNICGIIMIKRVIFDLDDTIFCSQDYYKKRISDGLKETIYENNEEIIKEIDESFDYYEQEYQIYNSETYVQFFNKKYHRELTIKMFEKLNIEFMKSLELKPNVHEILEYLSNKYEIVALTNYLYEVQKSRLTHNNILKYFKEIYAGDTNICKPYAESYNKACGPYKHEECIIIGDSLLKDYECPIGYGLKAILYDDKNTHQHIETRISNLIELKKYL